MTGQCARQSVLCPKEIDRASLTIILAEDADAPLIVRRKAMVGARDGADHFFPTKLIGEQLRQRGRMRRLSPWRLEMYRAHIGKQFLRREEWKNGGRKERGQRDHRRDESWLGPFQPNGQQPLDRDAAGGEEHRVDGREIVML